MTWLFFCRIHNALKGIPDDRDGLFDTIQRSKNHYQKRAYQCIKCMVALFSNCPVAYQILQVIPFILFLAAFFPQFGGAGGKQNTKKKPKTKNLHHHSVFIALMKLQLPSTTRLNLPISEGQYIWD